MNEEFVNSVNARCACLGEVLAFSCTVVDGGSGATVWGGSAFDCGGNEITLIHHNFNHGTSAECNDRAIIGESISVSDDETCFTSRLNVTISIGLRNKTVNCSDSGTQIIGSSTIGVAGKLILYHNIVVTMVHTSSPMCMHKVIIGLIVIAMETKRH